MIGILVSWKRSCFHPGSRCSILALITSLVAQAVKNLPTMQETWIRYLGWIDPRKRAWQPAPAFWPEEAHGQRSLVGYSPWGHKEPDTTERLGVTLTTCFLELILRSEVEPRVK